MTTFPKTFVTEVQERTYQALISKLPDDLAQGVVLLSWLVAEETTGEETDQAVKETLTWLDQQGAVL